MIVTAMVNIPKIYFEESKVTEEVCRLARCLDESPLNKKFKTCQILRKVKDFLEDIDNIQK